MSDIAIGEAMITAIPAPRSVPGGVVYWAALVSVGSVIAVCSDA
ncbi:MAG: hypothetical protein RLZZ227_417 [Pseudomonadota bacterium]|jgi:hypothetical protein